MAKYITIDGGTTNTRISLICDNKITDTVKYSIGAAIGCDNKKLIKERLKEEIEKLLSKHSTEPIEIRRILASGMITSEGGICTLEHLIAPCGIEEMAKGIYETRIDEISPIPFAFARGVKTNGSDLGSLDVMRGEETELLGLSKQVENCCLYVLPGSHTKLIYTDESGRISDFCTTLTGEMINAVSQNTIIKNSVSLKDSKFSLEYLHLGYNYAKENGMSSAFFKVRVLDKFFGRAADEIYSFFIGASLQPEIDKMISADVRKILVGGKQELRYPISELLKEYSDKEIVEIEDIITQNAAAYGIIRLYDHYEKIEVKNGKAL